MPSIRFTIAATVIASTSVACRTATNLVDVPAVIANPSPETHAELERVLSAALYGADITVAEDALTASSRLTIDRTTRGSLDAPPVDGRRLDVPVQFRLLVNGPNCVLVNEADGRRWRIAKTICIPE